MPDTAIEILTSMGLPGVVILAMGWWIFRQDGRISALQTRLDSLQELRVQDAQRIAAGVASLSEALERQSAKLDAVMERRGR
jgi:hypothetical protein